MNRTSLKQAMRRPLLTAATALALLGAVAACAAMARLVPLDEDEFVPALRGDFSQYRGHNVFLTRFVLRTVDTAQHTYRSRDGKFIFEPVAANATKWLRDLGPGPQTVQPSPLDLTQQMVHADIPYLNYYLWNCAAKALQAVGMTVYAEPPASYGGPMLNPIVLALDDEHLVVQVKLLRPALVFDRTYAIHDPFPSPDQRTTDALARKSYAMINRFVEELLGDPDFARAFLERQ